MYWFENIIGERNSVLSPVINEKICKTSVVTDRKMVYNLGFTIERSKNSGFSKSIAACDLEISRCILLIELMKICKYSRSRPFIDLSPRSFTNQN